MNEDQEDYGDLVAEFAREDVQADLHELGFIKKIGDTLCLWEAWDCTVRLLPFKDDETGQTELIIDIVGRNGMLSLAGPVTLIFKSAEPVQQVQ